MRQRAPARLLAAPFGTVGRSTSKSTAAAATEAVKQWKYKPAMLHGKPVPVYFTVLVRLCE